LKIFASEMIHLPLFLRSPEEETKKLDFGVFGFGYSVSHGIKKKARQSPAPAVVAIFLFRKVVVRQFPANN